jgi:hypothetical protein
MPFWAPLALAGMVLTALIAFTDVDCGLARTWALQLFKTADNVKLVFGAACLVHYAEAAEAARLCLNRGEPGHASAWFASTLLVGYPSLGVLLRGLSENKE